MHTTLFYATGLQFHIADDLRMVYSKNVAPIRDVRRHRRLHQPLDRRHLLGMLAELPPIAQLQRRRIGVLTDFQEVSPVFLVAAVSFQRERLLATDNDQGVAGDGIDRLNPAVEYHGQPAKGMDLQGVRFVPCRTQCRQGPQQDNTQKD